MTTWGNQVQRWRAGVDAWVASTTDTTATITVVNYWQSMAWGYNVSGLTGFCDIQGEGEESYVDLGSVYSATGATVTKEMRRRNITVSRTGSDRTVTARVGIYMPSYHTGTSYATVSVTVPHRQWYAPNPPKDAKLARVSDTSQKLTWAGDYTSAEGARPWTGVYVDRRVDEGSWSRLATLGWSAVNYSDNGTSAGHRYDYAVYSYNAVGTSSHVNFSPGTFTTPTAFTGVRCSKPTTTTVQLTPTTSPKWYDSVVCQGSTDNGLTWADCTIDSETLIISDPPKGQVKFRLAAVKASGGTTSTDLQGAWCESDTIATLCAPLAPTISNLPAVVAVDTVVAVEWTPNHPDGTPQSKAQVRITKADDTTYTTAISGATTRSSFTASAAGTWYVQVRTHGEYEEGDDEGWGAWSANQPVIVAVAPVLSITEPTDGSTATKLPIRVAWDYSDATGMSSQTLTIAEVTRGAATTIDVPIGTSYVDLTTQVDFRNRSAYTLTVSVRAGSGLTATATAAIETEWEQPDAPDVTFDNADCKCQLTIKAQETEPAAVSFDVRRVNLDGSTTLIATGAESGHTIYDNIPPLNVDYAYQVTSYAASGAVNTTTYSNYIDSDGYEAFGFGQDAGTTLLLRYNATGSDSYTPSGNTFHLALGDGQDKLPTFYADGDIDCTGSHSYVVTTVGEYRMVRTLAMKYAEAYYRDAFGGVYLVKVGWKRDYDASAYNQWNISADVTECAWEEPVYGID